MPAKTVLTIWVRATSHSSSPRGQRERMGFMKKSFRLALLTGACFLGLAFAAPAFSAYNPSLIMEQSSYKLGATSTAGVVIGIDPDADPPAQLRIFAPAGYSANLTAAPGTKIGSVVARGKAEALGGGPVTVTARLRGR